MRFAKTVISSAGNAKNMGKTMDAIKEILRAISGLVDEIKLTHGSSKRGGAIRDAEELTRETEGVC